MPAVAGSVGINRLREESTELLTDAQFFAQAGFHNPVASAKASKAGQTVRLKPGMHLARLLPCRWWVCSAMQAVTTHKQKCMLAMPGLTCAFMF